MLRKGILFFICYFYSLLSLQAGFEIIELMPNTVDDTNLEYVIILNNSDVLESLEGYYLQDASGKKYIFSGDEILSEQEEKKFLRPQTKIILNNTNEILSLYSGEDILEHEVEYKKTTKGVALKFGNIQDENSNEEISEEYIENTDQEQEEQKLEILFSLQRPSYITQSGSSDIYICDSGRDECKVNFNLEESFSGEYSKSDYLCIIDFGIMTGEEEKCNPNTVIFPEGKSQVMFKIFHEDTNVLISQKEIEVIFDRSITSSQIVPDKKSTQKQAKLALRKPNIIVQSGLDGQGTNFYCQKMECKMNLNYEKIHNDERCFWNFGPGLASSETTRTRCNPGYVDIPEGSFVLSLRIYESGFENNSKTQEFYIHNLARNQEIEEQVTQEDTVIILGEEETQEVIQSLEASIVVQGKISQEKNLSGNTLTCFGAEECYVNFSSEINQRFSDAIYRWKDNGNIFSEKQNPLGEWFTLGEHEIEFEIIENDTVLLQEIFYISVEGKDNEAVVVPDIGNEDGLGEPILFDTDIVLNMQEEENIKFTQNFLILKYDGLRISGQAPIGSKVEVYIGEEKVGETIGNEKGKYRIVSKNFIEGNYVFDTKLVLQNEKEIFLKNSGKKEIISEDRSYWFISKKKSSRKKKISKQAKKTQFIIKTSQNISQKNIRNEENTDLSLINKIMFYVFLLGISLLGVFHILSIIFSEMGKTVTIAYFTTMISVRQKVCLIVT